MVRQQEIRDHVARLLDSEQFVGSRSITKLLTFCVDTTLAGNEEELKETTIGIFCFGRTPGYDTKQDPIVRVTAGRLRKKLELFYQNETENHELQIVLPRGTYVPRFNRWSNQSPAVKSAPEEDLIFTDHALTAEAEHLSFEKIPAKTLVTGRSWLRAAMWSFLVLLLMVSCRIFLTRADLLQDPKAMAPQEHPSRLSSSTTDPASSTSVEPRL